MFIFSLVTPGNLLCVIRVPARSRAWTRKVVINLSATHRAVPLPVLPALNIDLWLANVAEPALKLLAKLRRSTTQRPNAKR